MFDNDINILKKELSNEVYNEGDKIGFFKEVEKCKDNSCWAWRQFGISLSFEKTNNLKEIYILLGLFKIIIVFGYRWLSRT